MQLPAASPALAPPRKAALIVNLLVSEGLCPDLSALTDAGQTRLAREIGALGRIDRATLDRVAAEFAAEVDAIALTAPGSLARALDRLDGHIAAPVLDALRREAGIGAAGDPWERLSALGTDTLAPVLAAERPEVAAVILSKLRTARAAELLSALPGALARTITLAIPRVAATDPGTVAAIGQALAASLDNGPPPAFEDGPVPRLGAILNTTTAAIRDDVLAAFEEVDADFARAVRAAIFTFENIPARIAPRDVPRVLRELDEETLVQALAAGRATAPEAVEYILANVSNRMAEQLRDTLSDRAAPALAAGEAAMTALILRIREMEAAGDLVLAVEEG